MSEYERLQFLVEVVEQEEKYLSETDKRVFAQPFSVERAAALKTNIDEAERVDAFVARFGRLQDTGVCIDESCANPAQDLPGTAMGLIVSSSDRHSRAAPALRSG